MNTNKIKLSAVLLICLIAIGAPIYAIACTGHKHDGGNGDTDKSVALNTNDLMDYCGKTTKSGSVFSTWYGAIDEFGAREGDYNQKTGLYSTHPITASGDEFNAKLLTAASNVVPLGSYITLNANGKDMTVLINDRIGAPAPDTCVDLSSGAFYKITGDLCSSRLKIDSGTVSATKPDDYVTGDMVDFHNMKLTECAP